MIVRTNAITIRSSCRTAASFFSAVNPARTSWVFGPARSIHLKLHKLYRITRHFQLHAMAGSYSFVMRSWLHRPSIPEAIGFLATQLRSSAASETLWVICGVFQFLTPEYWFGRDSGKEITSLSGLIEGASKSELSTPRCWLVSARSRTSRPMENGCWLKEIQRTEPEIISGESICR